MAEEILLTKEGLEKVKEELDHLVSVRRAEVSEHLKEAKSYGDLSENAEYDAAKDEQAELEERIVKLENMIRKAKIIDESEIQDDKVTVGVKVKVKNVATGELEEYIIVGSTEADPFAEPVAKISNESLVGQALLGADLGSTVEVIVPDGIVNYEIVSIG